MKKILLLLSLGVATAASAQYNADDYSPDLDTATYKGTNSGIALNLPTVDGDGFQLNFSKDPQGKLDPAILNCSFNRFGTPGYTATIDSSINDGVLIYTADETNEDKLASQNLKVGNCLNYVLDMSGTPSEERIITARVKASGGDVEFTIFAAVNDAGDFAVAGAGTMDGIASQTISAGDFQNVQFRIADTTDFNNYTDHSTIIGWSLQIKGEGTLTFDKITFGSFAPPLAVNEFVSNEASFSVYPNPVTDGVINFSETVEEVELYNIQGNLVKAGSNVNKLSVDGLESGIYVVQSTQGYKRVVIK